MNTQSLMPATDTVSCCCLCEQHAAHCSIAQSFMLLPATVSLCLISRIHRVALMVCVACRSQRDTW